MATYNRKLAIQKVREYWAMLPIYLDTETTGTHPTAEIIEISIVDHQENTLLDTLVRPTRLIPLDAIQIHHITDDMVTGAPTWLEIWPKVQAIVQGRYVGIYNADFDIRMMRQSFQAHSQPWVEINLRTFCLMKLYAEAIGSPRWLPLEEARRRAGILLPNAHRARDDSLVARALHQYLATRS